MNISNFAVRLSNRVPWNKHLTFVGMLAARHNDTAETIININMYSGDLLELFTQEEIDFLKWIFRNFAVFKDMFLLSKKTIARLRSNSRTNSFSEELYSDYIGENECNKILDSFGLTSENYFLKATQLSRQIIANLKIDDFEHKLSNYDTTIILYKTFVPDISIRIYMTVNPSSIEQTVNSLLKKFLNLAVRNKKGAMLKFQHYYRLDTVVVYTGKYFLDFVEKMDDNLFLDINVPFTKRIAKGRSIATYVTITKALEKEQNIPEDEQSNAGIICKVLGNVMQTFIEKLGKYPSNDHEIVVVVLYTCEILFRHRIEIIPTNQ